MNDYKGERLKPTIGRVRDMKISEKLGLTEDVTREPAYSAPVWSVGTHPYGNAWVPNEIAPGFRDDEEEDPCDRWPSIIAFEDSLAIFGDRNEAAEVAASVDRAGQVEAGLWVERDWGEEAEEAGLLAEVFDFGTFVREAE